VAQGEIPAGELTLGNPVDWATFEFALPDYLSYQVPRGDRATFVNKRTVFIVNDKAMSKFFSKVVQLGHSDGPPTE
jgi:hypothetical protein